MKRFGVWMLVVLIAIMDFGYVRLGFAQTEDDDLLPVRISGASGRSVRTNVTFAFWAWTAPVTGPVIFDNDGTGFDTLLGIYGDDDTMIASNFDLDTFTLRRSALYCAAGPSVRNYCIPFRRQF